MKKYIAALIILFMLPVTVFAHSGDTDAYGGHWEGSDYHYHHGYPAHDHYDMDGDGDIDCPYNFKDNTGSNSGSGSGSKFTHTDPNPSTFVKGESSTVIRYVTPDWVAPLILALVVLILGLVLFGLWFIQKKNNDHRREMLVVTSSKDEQIKGLTDDLAAATSESESLRKKAALLSGKIVELALDEDRKVAMRTADIISRRDQTVRSLQARCDRKDHEIQDLLGTLDFLKLYYPQSGAQARLSRSLKRYGEIHGKNIAIPDDVIFVDGRYPVRGKVDADHPFGDYTIFIAGRGQVYHSRKWCGGSYAMAAHHVFEVDRPIRPCKTCAKPMDTVPPNWYVEIRKALPYLHSYE